MKLAAAGGLGGAVCALARSRYERRSLSVEETEIISPKIKKDKTLVFLSDLHNNEFGKGNRGLLAAIDRIRPDGVLSGGDMMVVKDGRAATDVPLALLRALSGRYPVFCGNGNHENRMERKKELYGDQYQRYRDQVRAMGITYLENETVLFGEDIQIGAADLDKACYRKAFLKRVQPMRRGELREKLGWPERDRFVILLAHTPMYFKDYREWGADLSLCGHFHGGTIRLPWLGGVMTPQYQFFLPWCAGTFREEGRYMVVSRGLGTHSINIRINNLSQLVVLRLKGR